MLKKLIRTLTKTVFWTGFTGIAAHHFHNGFTDGRIVRHVEIPIKSSKITTDLDGYKFAFVSDIHRTKPEKLEEIVVEINKRSPDMLLLGGDFFGNRIRSWESLKILSEVATVDGIYGIEGNHDNYKDLFMGMRLYGMTPLDNEGIEVRPGLFVGGVADYYNRIPDTKKALKYAKKDDFTILLSHNPDVTMKWDTRKTDITLAGHVHAGEMALFGHWSPMLSINLPNPIGTSEYYHRFQSGWAKSRDGRPVYVGNGIGKHGPLRIYAPPQVIYFTLSGMGL